MQRLPEHGPGGRGRLSGVGHAPLGAAACAGGARGAARGAHPRGAQPVFATALGGLGASGYAVAAARQAIASGSYAGFWIRASLSIDSALTGIVIAAVFVMAGRGPMLLASLGVGLLYHPVMESSGSRGTLGKIFCGLTVADRSRRRISFGRAFARNLAKILSALTLDIGYTMAGGTQRKQALHDFIAQTIVLKQ